MNKLMLFVACVAILAGCKAEQKETAKLSPEVVELKATQTHQLTVTEGATASEWSSSDTFVSSVTSSGLVEAKHIGEAVISANVNGSKLSCKVTVSAKYNSFNEPLMDWGASKATIKQKEKRTLENDTEDALYYKEPRTNGILYLFEKDKLITAGLVLPLKFDAEELVGFLTERYTIVGESDDLFLWLSKDGKMTIAVGVETVGVLVAYIPNTKGSSVDMAKLQQIKNLPLATKIALYSTQEIESVRATMAKAIGAK